MSIKLMTQVAIMGHPLMGHPLMVIAAVVLLITPQKCAIALATVMLNATALRFATVLRYAMRLLLHLLLHLHHLLLQHHLKTRPNQTHQEKATRPYSTAP